MNKYLGYIILSLVIVIPAKLSSQQFSILNYTINDGLPSNQIVSEFQDSNGFLWIGTNNGLSRFNGKGFVNYGYTEGLTDLYVNTIFEDSHHHLWIGTLHGICEVKGNRIVQSPIKNNKEFITCSFNEIGDKVWASTGDGMYHLVDSVWRPAIMKNGLAVAPCTQVVSATGGLYINNENQILFIQNNQSITQIQKPSKDYFDKLTLYNNRVFVNTKTCLYEIINDNLKLLIDSIPSTLYFNYYVDRNNNYWILVADKGLYCYHIDNGKTSVIYSYNIVNAIGFPFADNEHNLWLASYDGLIRIQPKFFKEIYIKTDEQQHKKPYIKSTGDDQLIIFGADGPQYLRNDQLTNLKLPSSYQNINTYLEDVVEGSDKDKENNSWFITRTHRLFCWNGNNLMDYSALVPPQQEPYIYNISVNKINDSVFFCGDSTVIAGNKNHFGIYHDKYAKTFSKPTWVSFTSNGIGIVNVYFKGIYFITKDNQIIKAPHELDVIDKGRYTCFFEEKKGYVWASNAGKGLVRFRISEDYSVKDISVFTTANGLPDNRIVSMAFDTNENIWINTLKDVAVIKNADSTFSASDVYTIGWEQGIVHEAILSGQLTEDNKGHVWVPAIDRVIEFNSNQFRLTKTVPNVVIEKVRLNLQETDWRNYSDSISGYFQLPVHPVLKYFQNSLAVHFIGTCLSDASQLEYSYRLKPINKSWSNPSSNTIVSVLNLAPGNYTFEVRARASKSSWSKPAVFVFTITEPFWDTWWFKTIIVLFGAALITLVFRYRVKQIRKQEVIKNTLIQLETKALKAQMNPHFIYNALNSIQSLILNDQAVLAGSYISQFAKLLRQILENADSNVITLDKELYSLQLYISLEQLRLNFDLIYEEEIDPNVFTDAEKIPPLILQPFVENALWHGLSKKQGEKLLRIKVAATNEWLVCEIFDNGVGREKALKQYNIFPEGHLSKATSVTIQRLLDFNQPLTTAPISFADHINSAGESLGTTVTIKIKRLQEI